MAQQTKSLRLRGSIHDVRYLFTGIRAVLLSEFPMPKEEIVENVRKEVLEYNQSTAEKYNLSKPRSIGYRLAFDIVTELRGLNMLEFKQGKYKFSQLGEYVASLLKDGKVNEFRNEMTKLIVEGFSQLPSFLMELYNKTNTGELVLPKVDARLFNEICGQDTTIMAERIIDHASIGLHPWVTSKLDINELQRKLDPCLEKTKGQIKSLVVEVDRYLISKLFGPSITSRRLFDVIRDMCESLFLVNFGTFHDRGLTSEIIYLISWIIPEMKTPDDVSQFTEIHSKNGRKILIHNPSGPTFHKRFAETVTEVYNDLPSQFGFIGISNLRDHVCKDLRIHDRLFDSEIMKLHEEKPQKFGLSYSFERTTSKRLPIVIGDKVKTIYNLISIR